MSVIQSEVSQKEKEKYCVCVCIYIYIYIYGIYKDVTDEFICGTTMETHRNRLVDTGVRKKGTN